MQRLSVSGMLLLACLGGCASDIAKTPPGAPPAQPVSYLIGPDDKLHVTVYGEPQLTGDYMVNNQGQLSLPLAGEVPVAGLTVAQVAAKLTATLSGTVFKSPNVSVDMLAYRPVYVLGEVSKAGQIPFQSGMTALDAIAAAGGFTYRANQRIVMIRHPGAASEERDRLTADLMVGPGDTVRVKERYF